MDELVGKRTISLLKRHASQLWFFLYMTERFQLKVAQLDSGSIESGLKDPAQSNMNRLL